ncbi:MAG: hypothetical protein H8E60_10920 [Candidatus Marinimicrobia bacterium]|nr:hypothetical protein [Candidatus Neomarinimicrobiota bacterium]
MIRLLKKHALLILLILVGGCQQCILEYQSDPKLGFDPQAISLRSNEYFNLNIIINEIESPFFGVSFHIEYDTTLIELSCDGNNLTDPFFGENNLITFINPQNGIIYSSLSLMNGQDPVSGSGNIASCNGYTKIPGTAWINFKPESFYFIDNNGNELVNSYQNNDNYSQLDSSLIIFDFELLNARIDIDHPGIIDN